MKNILLFLKKHIIYLLVALLTIYFLISYLYNTFRPAKYIVIQFDELGPIYKRMPVYYKGYKIGITKEIKPSDNYRTTLVTIKFFPNELKLPNNTIAKVKPLTTTRDYIELVYPKEASDTLLKSGDTIKGSTTIDIKSFMNAQYESGAIGYIIENASLTMSSITMTSNEAKKLLFNINETVTENKKALVRIMNNLDKTSKNISELSHKLNENISEKNLTLNDSNIQKSLANIEEFSNSINSSLKRVDSVLCNIDGLTANLNNISNEIEKSVKHRKGLTGLFLGKKDNSKTNYAKK